MQKIHLPHPRLFLAVFALLAFLLIPGIILAQESMTVNLAPVNGSGVTGTVVLTEDGDGTAATVDLTGLPAGAEGTATLFANTCEQPSASFASVAQFTADDNGNVHATGRVLFHDTDVALSEISDGGRIISIHSGGEVVACGPLPSLDSPALPNTGGGLDSGRFALFGAVGLVVLGTGLLIAKTAQPKPNR